MTTPVYAKPNSDLANRKIKKILIVVAMNTEAKPIISALHLQQAKTQFAPLPMQAFVGKINNIDLFLIENGAAPASHVQNVGTQAATLTTYVGFERFKPDLIISIGTAGGVAQNGAHVNAIYYSTKIYFFDRRLPVNGYREYALGGYPSLDISPIAPKIGMKPGIICSGDSFDQNKTDYNMFIRLHCTAIDMEAAGVAWVSSLTHTPVLAIKGITNFVRGKNIHEDYRRNLHVMTTSLSITLKQLLIHFSQR